jgi:hypothetical protein
MLKCECNALSIVSEAAIDVRFAEQPRCQIDGLRERGQAADRRRGCGTKFAEKLVDCDGDA